MALTHWSPKHVGTHHEKYVILLTLQLGHFSSLEQRGKELGRLGKVLELNVGVLPQLGKSHSQL